MKPITKQVGYFDSFDGTSIYYEKRGQGPTILMAYGIGCLINHWRYQLEYFSHNYTTLIMDFRGHHKSGTPDLGRNLTIEAIAKDVLGLIEHVGAESVSGWGHSFGCQVLMQAQKMDRSRFNSFVFVNGFTHNPFEKQVKFEHMITAIDLAKKTNEMVPETVKSLWSFGVGNPFLIPLSHLAGGFNIKLTNLRDIEIYARGVQNMDFDVFMTLFEELISFDFRNDLNEIKAPALIVSGEKDQITPTSYQDFMCEQIDRSELLRVPYGSHCTQLDFPEFLNLRTEKFLRDNELIAR